MSTLQQYINTSCVILSGGFSSRMGAHKALLRYSEQENFLEHIISIYRGAGIDNIIVVKNSSIDLGDLSVDSTVRIVDNYFPEKGRLYSVQLGLKCSPPVDHCFIQNIDNPFVTVPLLQQLLDAATLADYITPVYRDAGGHPILVSSAVIVNILDAQDHNLTLRDVLGLFRRHKLEASDEKCTLNINLPADYREHFNNIKQFNALS